MKKTDSSKSLVLLLLFIVFIGIGCNSNNQKTGEFQAVHNMVSRVLPAHADAFIFKSLPLPNGYVAAFELSSTANGHIIIRATDPSAASKGVNHYIRHYLNGNISRGGTQIPEYEQLPQIPNAVTVKTQMPVRYYFNYCTFSYSMPFWTWEDWEKELDWMALQGINLALAVVGNEAVWYETLQQFNFSDKEIFDFIPGPAYTAWWLMDNLEGWGGPVSQEWIDSRVVLQKKILARMHELGIEPVLHGFYGMVPNAMIEKYPENQIHKDTIWGGLQRPAFLDPRDSLFNKMSNVYHKAQEKLYGKANYYSGDPFHEGGKKMGDLTKSAKIIQGLMQQHSPGATWVLQGWQESPTDALLAGTDKQHTLVLDLCGEGQPWYAKRNSFNDRHFLWCNINNFGNNTYSFAKFDSVVMVPARMPNSRFSENFKGMGMMMEGSFTDPIVYDLFYDVPWADRQIEQSEWLTEYAEYRYGKSNAILAEAVQTLGKTIYNAQHRTENVLCARPSLDAERVTTWAPGAEPCYDQDALVHALQQFVSVQDPEITGTATYQFDMANIARQVITGKSFALLQDIKSAYQQKNTSEFKALSNKFLTLIMVTDSLVAQMPNFSFYDWQQNAMAQATTPAEAELFLWNANRLLTLWSNEQGATTLHDYAYREWYGLFSNFYYPRWNMYFKYLEKSMQSSNIEPIDFYQWEDEWCNRKFTQPANTGYDIKAIIKRHILKD